MQRDKEGFYESSCPLCQQDVDISQPDVYRVLPLNLERIAIFSERPIPKIYGNNSSAVTSLRFSDLFVGGRIINVHEYIDRTWLLHNRCLGFVDYLPPQKLHLLFDLVEPTWIPYSNPPRTQHGAFYLHAHDQAAQPIRHDINPEPAPNTSRRRRFRTTLQRALSAICQCIIPQKQDDQDGGRPTLPAEIWDLILQDDLGRLLFIMKTAAQIANLDFQFRPPKKRFTVVEFHLTSPILQVHVITIGGRSYITNLSSRVDFRIVKNSRTICLDVSSSTYLAVKVDGFGVVDIAVEEQDGIPKWALGNGTKPFTIEISQIRGADLRSLRLVRDSLKCRAIIPSNRGPEPYFCGPEFPPTDSWVKSGFLIQPEFPKQEEPLMHFVRASYIPFSELRRVYIRFEPIVSGIVRMYMNEETYSQKPHKHDTETVTFRNPPTRLKLLVVSRRHVRHAFFSYIQFDVDGQWLPAINRRVRVHSEFVVENVAGIWRGKSRLADPIGVVLTLPTDRYPIYSPVPDPI